MSVFHGRPTSYELIQRTFTPILVFLRIFVFELGARARQTDGRTDAQDPQCGLLGWLHINVTMLYAYHFHLEYNKQTKSVCRPTGEVNAEQVIIRNIYAIENDTVMGNAVIPR